MYRFFTTGNPERKRRLAAPTTLRRSNDVTTVTKPESRTLGYVNALGSVRGPRVVWCDASGCPMVDCSPAGIEITASLHLVSCSIRSHVSPRSFNVLCVCLWISGIHRVFGVVYDLVFIPIFTCSATYPLEVGIINFRCYFADISRNRSNDSHTLNITKL